MAKTTSQHLTIYTYLKKYQDDPLSRVFAPLAEAYRKAGLIDEAVKIAQEGVKIHPGFIGGRVALARALFDQRQFERVIGELSEVVQDIPDNLVAQRLLAESYLILGQLAAALNCYKMLLYFAPQDLETAKLVQELESQAYEKGALILKKDPAPMPLPQFDVKSAHLALGGDPSHLRTKKVKQIEMLQELLQRVERYRTRVELSGGALNEPSVDSIA